ncbi:MAG: MraY family glycosyltransferase [Phycisphaeraceae bacterium]
MAIALPLTAVLAHVGRRWAWLDEVGGEAHKAHAQAVPNTGGVALFVAIALPMAAALAAVWGVPMAWWERWLPAAAVHVPGLRQVTALGAVLLGTMAVLHGVGLVDDRRALGPGAKLAAQLVVAIVLVLAGFRVLSVLDTFGAWGVALSGAVTVAWIVVIVNAFNFLDNMDGLSGGVGAIIAALYLAATLLSGQWFVAGLAALLVGALLGFLVFNVSPARIFMGDGGSLVIGLLLAVISVRTTYFDPEAIAPTPGRHWYGVLMPVMVMAIPLYDFTSVTLIRLMQGRSPFRGDQQHFSHRLVALGLSRRRAVGVIWLCTLATGLSGVMLGSLAVWQALLAAAQTIAVVALLAVLEHGARQRSDGGM